MYDFFSVGKVDCASNIDLMVYSHLKQAIPLKPTVKTPELPQC